LLVPLTDKPAYGRVSPFCVVIVPRIPPPFALVKREISKINKRAVLINWIKNRCNKNEVLVIRSADDHNYYRN
jgi:hypothetical protein